MTLQEEEDKADGDSLHRMILYPKRQAYVEERK
jgi:hypothetical protein